VTLLHMSTHAVLMCRRVAGTTRRMTGSCALALLCAADLLVALDGMVVMVALPAIERDLGASHADLQWVVTAYTLTLGAFLLVGGRAGDLYGRRRMLVAGLLVFAFASLAAGLARATGPLLAARAIQGIGAALAVPAALALLTAIFRSERERERALGRLSATLDAGMVAGLVLGGLLTASLGWPWCFFVVVPVGLAAAALVPAAIAESRDEAAPPLDLAGAVLAAAGFGLLALGLVRFEHARAAGAAIVAVALVLLAAFVAVERRVQAPMVRLAVFRHRPLTGAKHRDRGERRRLRRDDVHGDALHAAGARLLAAHLAGHDRRAGGREGPRLGAVPDVDAPRRRVRADGARDGGRRPHARSARRRRARRGGADLRLRRRVRGRGRHPRARRDERVRDAAGA
jgi:Major Facilitator Superfamily